MMSGQQAASRDWKIVDLYESGKGRRYQLLFTINGGAYALIGFLAANAKAFEFSFIGIWAFILIPAALAIYTCLMYRDIDAFATNMKAYDPELYKEHGRLHLKYVCALLTVSWILTIIAIIIQWSHISLY